MNFYFKKILTYILVALIIGLLHLYSADRAMKIRQKKRQN